MKFSVACNFDDALLEGLAPYPVYEVYGKLTSDYFGGGRPSFYLPEVGREDLERYVRKTHAHGIQFNYLLNASAMDNVEYTRRGQRELAALLEWVDGIGVDAITVANIYMLRTIKRRHPRIKVRISAHRFTDSPRKVRFWQDEGADLIVVNEVAIHRELELLRSMREAAGDMELQLIVNNWCRQDCAIAGNHAVSLSSASQRGSKGFPLDYCSLECNHIRLTEPVNYLRANWIRPEDIYRYEELGYHNYKIVERNTPTPLLLRRVEAYFERSYDGNLLDLVQNYSYSAEDFGEKAKDAYSYRRLLKYFVKPWAINVLKLPKVMELGQTVGLLYPRYGANPVQIDNKGLEGFMKRFETEGCITVDCDACRYCHEWADKVVRIDPDWHRRAERQFDELLGEVDTGAMWEPYLQTLVNTDLAEWAKAGKTLLDSASPIPQVRTPAASAPPSGDNGKPAATTAQGTKIKAQVRGTP